MSTPRLGLPYIIAGQAQKEITHADSLNLIDAYVQASVIDILNTPPTSGITNGDLYIVSTSPTGAWAGKARQIAYRLAGSWAFLKPLKSMLVFVDNKSAFYRYNGTNWIDAKATTSISGFMSSADKAKLDGIENGAEVNKVNAFLDLEDVPISFTGFAGKFLAVNLTENGLVFVPAPESGAGSFIELTDVPEAFVAGKWLKVNDEGTALVFTDEPQTVGADGADGLDGQDGSIWYFGSAEPDNSGGLDGDYYLQADGKVWNKQSGSWVYTGISLKGEKGDVGDSGSAVGLPTQGLSGQVLAKKSDVDYDVGWIDPPEGGGSGGSADISDIRRLTFFHGS